jgi:hypothetical protein
MAMSLVDLPNQIKAFQDFQMVVTDSRKEAQGKAEAIRVIGFSNLKGNTTRDHAPMEKCR